MKIYNNGNIHKMLKTYTNNGSRVNDVSKVQGLKKDKIEISETARDFQVAKNAINKLPDVRQNKIEEMKEAIASGNYAPSAEEIVNQIVRGVDFDEKI